MGTAALHWQGGQFLFLMNRDKWDVLDAEPVKVTTTDGYEGGNEMWGGSWFGFKNGRFAFVLDSSDSKYSSTLVPRFLKSKVPPYEFAEKLAQKEAASFGLTLHLVVGESKWFHSMFYISKMSGDETRLSIDRVTFGIHTFSSGHGLDSHQEITLKHHFAQFIKTAGAEEQTIENITKCLMWNYPHFKELTDVFGNVKEPHTSHTVGLKVRHHPTKPKFFQWTAPAIATLEY